ncbi:MAG: 6-phosphogluconolactonase, 6-phosphogluconolactonase [Candidatus Saccharibacteria bacterium]|nr:6-phosphogluconolactonase, 6-phosphogluconolactonase [Candidatus Saccharibacteria bacterium]
MTEIRNYKTADDVAQAAAENAVEILQLSIEAKGTASWVLAGGSSPMLAYKKLVKDFADALDWSKVTVLIGDERMVALNHKDSNYGAISSLFNKSIELSKLKWLVPDTTRDTATAARDYAAKIAAENFVEFDLVWLGVGEDGHTLSLFPGNVAFTEPTDEWVIPVHDSPKPPSERITLSLKALEYVDELVIFAVGASKQDALKEARLKRLLPISVASDVVETNGGEVRWLYDEAAWNDD